MAEHFSATQAGFTRWLRQPASAPAPAGIAPRRLDIYRELLFNNVMTFVEGTFPVALALLPPPLAERLKQGFFADFTCTSPFFYDISLHFREYVSSLDWPELADFPWLGELLHYEWMELAADIAEAPNPAAEPDTLLAGADFPDSPTQPLRLASPTWPLAYQWRVHEWHENTDPGSLTPSPVCLLAWRDGHERVQVLAVEPLAAWLIEQILATEGATPQQLATTLTSATPGLAPEVALGACLRLLAGLRAGGIAFLA